jgi:CDP-diacylglycerol--glycerol-3-phosphate 3-phosphatidyltransferase
MWTQRPDEPAELTDRDPHLPRAVAGGGVADEIRRAADLRHAHELVGAAIFAVASLTDWADGYFARRRKQITPLGQVIDPLADKLLISAALISLVQMDLAPAWMVAVIIGREIAVTWLRSLAYARGVAIPASPLGKIKMVRRWWRSWR